MLIILESVQSNTILIIRMVVVKIFSMCCVWYRIEISKQCAKIELLSEL